jgi:hypothetical protein
MQINNNSAVSAMSYKQNQQSQPVAAQNTGAATLESDKVTLSQAGKDLGGVYEPMRGGGAIHPGKGGDK